MAITFEIIEGIKMNEADKNELYALRRKYGHARLGFIVWRSIALGLAVMLLLGVMATTALAQDADGGSSDSVTPDGPDSTVTVSDYGG